MRKKKDCKYNDDILKEYNEKNKINNEKKKK